MSRRPYLSPGVKSGIVAVFCPHTTAAIRINHNEPLLMQDIMKTLYRLVPIDQSYSHDLFEVRQNVAPNERSNGHAHVKAFYWGLRKACPLRKANFLLAPNKALCLLNLTAAEAGSPYANFGRIVHRYAD